MMMMMKRRVEPLGYTWGFGARYWRGGVKGGKKRVPVAWRSARGQVPTADGNQGTSKPPSSHAQNSSCRHRYAYKTLHIDRHLEYLYREMRNKLGHAHCKCHHTPSHRGHSLVIEKAERVGLHEFLYYDLLAEFQSKIVRDWISKRPHFKGGQQQKKKFNPSYIQTYL